MLPSWGVCRSFLCVFHRVVRHAPGALAPLILILDSHALVLALPLLCNRAHFDSVRQSLLFKNISVCLAFTHSRRRDFALLVHIGRFFA